jgi:GTP-binding nuclear protein Ran
MAVTEYKIVLVGDGNVGKTTWVKRLLTNVFEPRYDSTLGVEVNPIHMNTNRGPMVFYIWDSAGVHKNAGLREAHYLKGDGVIVMYDVNNQESAIHIEKWANAVNRVCNDIPMVQVATKCDDGNLLKLPSHCIGISTKSNLSSGNTLTPLLELVRKIRNDPGLNFK